MDLVPSTEDLIRMDMPSTLPKGTNLRLLLQGCRCSLEWLNHPTRVVAEIRRAVRDSGMKTLKHASYAFPEGGYTLALILSESHVVIHTWPEHARLVLIEISLCDFHRSNRTHALDLGERLLRLFSPEHALREVTSMVPRLSDRITPDQGFYVAVDSLLETRQSPIQEITLADTQSFGRTLLLDGVVQTTEKDDFYYHEPLVHAPMLAHPRPARVLICGGGDGGAAREVLKHPSVESCDLVDIDEEVVNLAREKMVAIHQGALDHPKIHIHIQDAFEFVRCNSQRYDVIIVDTTDPERCARQLATEHFFHHAARSLRADGWLSLHAGAPLCPDEFSNHAVHYVQKRFAQVYPYVHFVPSYGTLTGFLLAAKKKRTLPSLSLLQRRIKERRLSDLRIITPHTFLALFALSPSLAERFHSSPA